MTQKQSVQSQKQKNRARLSLGIAILTILTLVVSLNAGSNKAAIITLVGTAKIAKSEKGPWKKLKLHDVVVDSSWIETGPASKLTIFYKDSQVRLGANTRVQIQSLTRPGGARIKVKKGFTWYKVKKRKLRIVTPTAVASVRGTMFAVTHDKYGTATCVCKGAIETTSRYTPAKFEPVEQGYSNTYNMGKLLKKDFRRYFKKLKVDNSFKKEIEKDPKLASCKTCHKMTDIESDDSEDPDDY